MVTSAADKNSNIIFGSVIDESLSDEVRVTVIATGFDGGGGPRRTHIGARRLAPRRRDGRPRRAASSRSGTTTSTSPSFLK